MVSIASAQGEEAEMVVTGLRRREAMVAPWKASFLAIESRREMDCCAPVVLGVIGGVGGRRSLAASQSSSTN